MELGDRNRWNEGEEDKDETATFSPGILFYFPFDELSTI